MERVNYLFPDETTERKQNTCLVAESCDVCGRMRRYCLSELILVAGYGSKKYDGEHLTLNVCGDCIDKAFDFVLKTKGCERVQ